MNKPIILLLFLSKSLLAIPVGSGFNYQGSLSDQGSPANGNYDILFKAFPVEAGGTEYGVVPEFLAIEVADGLFNIDNVDFGDALYDGEEYWIEVSVRQTGTDNYVPLSPRQRLNATPYAVQAEFLAANGANSGEYLRFDGNNWVGNALNIEPTPWTLDNNDDLSYEDGNIGIGTNPSAALHVKQNDVNPVIIDGGNRSFMMIRENGNNRGYIGSFQTGTNTNDEDFEIGTVSNSTGNMHIVTGSNNPRITVTAEGKVGINNLIPGQDFVINGSEDGDVLRVNVNGDSKLLVDDNGGVGIGSLSTPPIDGLDVAGNVSFNNNLKVSGDTTFNGNLVSDGNSININTDIKQPITSNGLVKYLIHASCGYQGEPVPGGTSSTSIFSSYNAVNQGNVTIAETNIRGKCELTFPFDISQRYFYTSVPASTAGLGGTGVDYRTPKEVICAVRFSNTLNCFVYNAIDGDPELSSFMLFVY